MVGINSVTTNAITTVEYTYPVYVRSEGRRQTNERGYTEAKQGSQPVADNFRSSTKLWNCRTRSWPNSARDETSICSQEPIVQSAVLLLWWTTFPTRVRHSIGHFAGADRLPSQGLNINATEPANTHNTCTNGLTTTHMYDWIGERSNW